MWDRLITNTKMYTVLSCSARGSIIDWWNTNLEIEGTGVQTEDEQLCGNAGWVLICHHIWAFFWQIVYNHQNMIYMYDADVWSHIFTVYRFHVRWRFYHTKFSKQALSNLW